MNRLLLLGLIGGGMYWLFRESARQNAERLYLEDAEHDRDYEDTMDRAIDREHEQELLDEALVESFPASDPPSIP